MVKEKIIFCCKRMYKAYEMGGRFEYVKKVGWFKTEGDSRKPIESCPYCFRDLIV